MDKTSSNHNALRPAAAALHECKKLECSVRTSSLWTHDSKSLPPTSTTRLELSRTSLTQPISAPLPAASPLIPSAHLPKSPTSFSSPHPLKQTSVLYLGYGSNLSTNSFRFPRDIQPLSAVCVHVPALDLTFDLAGMPYVEPCFANTAVRIVPTPAPPTRPLIPMPPSTPSDPSKQLKWEKGLVGVVYELTPEDYQKVIVTEGGGSAYVDILTPCFPIPQGLCTVDPIPRSVPFLAHTLAAPVVPPRHDESKLDDTEAQTKGPSRWPITRPARTGSAQPSRRYLNLLISGAAEHALPRDYQAYLQSLHVYHISTTRQLIGRFIAVNILHRITFLAFRIGRALADDKGRFPNWFGTLLAVWFNFCWAWYDSPLGKGLWGDGERTEGDVEDEDAVVEERWR